MYNMAEVHVVISAGFVLCNFVLLKDGVCTQGVDGIEHIPEMEESATVEPAHAAAGDKRWPLAYSLM